MGQPCSVFVVTAPANADAITAVEWAANMAVVKERIMGYWFIKGAADYRYGQRRRNLQNRFVNNRDEWPKNLASTHNRLANWKIETVGTSGPRQPRSGVPNRGYGTAQSRTGRQSDLPQIRQEGPHAISVGVQVSGHTHSWTGF